MEAIKDGATIWARQTMKSEIFNKPDKWFKIWFYLINQVNHKDIGQYKRGTCFLTYERIMDATKAKKTEVDHCIRWLKKSKMLATTKATRGFIVNILNYSLYQDLDSYKSDGISELKAIQKRHRSDTKNKYDKNDNNDKKNKHLDFVLLTDKEYKKLTEKFGEPSLKEKITSLNDYIGSKGVKYKSHYFTILSWERKNKPESGDYPQKSTVNEKARAATNKIREKAGLEIYK